MSEDSIVAAFFAVGTGLPILLITIAIVILARGQRDAAKAQAEAAREFRERILSLTPGCEGADPSPPQNTR